MNEETIFTEYDEYSDDLSDDETKYDIFRDPFFDIEPYLEKDDNISDNPNFKKLIFFLKSAWLDPYFYRNRTLCSMSTNDYLPEEKGLLILIQKLLDLDEDEPLDQYLLTVFCMITGRCSELLKFDKVTSTNISKVHFRAPFQIYSHPGEGPCCISPFLIILSINETVTFPTVVSKLVTVKVDEKRSHESPNDIKTIETIDGETTDMQKLFAYALREPPNLFPLSFDSGLTLTTKVTRFPTYDGGFWVRVTCEPFSIAYGSDISNGKGRFKYPWTNRFSGKHPPTLSENGIKTEVQWIDSPKFNINKDEIHRNDLDAGLQNFCPFSCPDYVEAFANSMRLFHSEINDFVAIWADPETNRIKSSDMPFLSMSEAEKPLIIVECNEFCKCHRNCPYCFTSHPPFPNLMLFYSPDKDWGVVATEDIEPGTLITTYAGELIEEDERHQRNETSNSVYFFSLEFGDIYTGLGYNALDKCNIGRFINQSHETSYDNETPFSQPNATARKILSTYVETCVIGIFSLRKIYKGEEINISYGEHYKMQRKCACNYCLNEVTEYKEMLFNIDNPADPKSVLRK